MARILCVALLAWIGLCASLGLAADRHWNVGSGLWTASSSWNPAVVPAPADNAFIDYWDFNTGTGGLARLNTATVSAVTAVTVTNGATLSMTGIGVNCGSLLVGTDVVLGTNSLHGALNIQVISPMLVYTGGMTIVDSLRLGVLSGVGTVNQNAGTLIVGNQIILGDTRQAGSMFNPAGIYNLSGGFLRTPLLEIGTHANSNGTFNLSGFGLTQIPAINVGGSGIGAVNQSGGTTTPTDLTIGTGLVSPPAGSDVYTMSGGSLSVGHITTIRRNGVFNQTGGTPWLGHLHLYDNAQINVSGPNHPVLRSYTMHMHSDQVRIDLNNNSMEVAFADIDHRDGITDALTRGYNGGWWTGNGITSSTAAANVFATHPTAVGFANISGVGFRVKYTYYGDANVDGQVDITDLSILASAWQTGGRFWYDGDFNYDKLVDITDLARLAQNWQAGVGAPLATTFDQALAAVGLGSVSIPEPRLTTSMALCLALMQRRRRPVLL